MNERVKIISLFSWMLFGFGLIGQQIPCLEKLPDEKVVLFTDRDYYLSGDQLWFDAFLFLDGELSSDWSKVLYLELYNDQKEPLIQQKYAIENGRATGVLDIPENAGTGHYYLRGYTQYQRNFPVEKLFTKVVSIVNPNNQPSSIHAPVLTPDSLRVKKSMGEALGSSSVHLNLILDKKEYLPRGKVDLTIDAELHAELVLTVRKKGTGHDSEDVASFLSINPWLAQAYSRSGVLEYPDGNDNLSENPINSLDWIPEMKGLTLSGKIRNKLTGHPVPNEYCITSVLGKEAQIHLAKTNAEGEFIFSYHDLEDEKDIYISVLGDQLQDYQLLVNKDFSTYFPAIEPIPFLYDSSRHSLFEALYINQQIGYSFDSDDKQLAYPKPDPVHPSFNLGAPDIHLEMKDFIYIPTMIEVFRELVPLVSVRGRPGNRKLNIYDNVSFTDYDSPLVLLDHVPVSDIDMLLKIEPALLNTIEVYYSEYLLGDHSFGGIISLRTSKEDFAGYKWTDQSVFVNYKTIQIPKTFQYSEYLDSGSYSDRKPNFSTLLYWYPGIHLKGKPLRFTFYTSDHLSDYEVVVRGFTREGKPCFGSVDFEVLK